MDNLTHTLTAVALSHAGFNRKTRFATPALVIGANLPDIDLAARLGGSATFLKYHRGITHSILGVTVLAALLAAIIYNLARRYWPKESGPPLDGGWLFTVCWIATGSHLLLDFTNSYGVRLFMPFSGRWYAWDIMFILDPLLLGLLAAGLGFPMILRLVSEEVGAKKTDLRRGAIFSLCSLVLLWGIRDFAHRRALNLLDSHTYNQENPRRLGAFPSPANPLAWTGVIETDSAFFVLTANALDTDVDAEHPQVFYKPEASPVLDAATKSRTAAIFLSFARFPLAHAEETEEGFTVILRDLRFLSPHSRRRGFVAEIELGKNLRMRSESFSFWAPARKDLF